jgi:hypothetical protein
MREDSLARKERAEREENDDTRASAEARWLSLIPIITCVGVAAIVLLVEIS